MTDDERKHVEAALVSIMDFDGREDVDWYYDYDTVDDVKVVLLSAAQELRAALAGKGES